MRDDDAKHKHKQLIELRDAFVAAFDELHDAVVRQVRTPGQHVFRHADYPLFSTFDSGFPHMSEWGFYREHAPKDFVSTVRSTTLMGLMGGLGRPGNEYPKGKALKNYLKGSPFLARIGTSELSGFTLDRMVEEAVERYLHLHGLDAPIEKTKRSRVVWPMLFAIVSRIFHLRLLVPVTLTHFDVDHFRLSEGSYIVRIPRKLQLARYKVDSYGSGAPKLVVGAATHAFVSSGWHVETESITSLRNSLQEISGNVVEAIDRFFGALRIVTGIATGYAQIVWVPKRWALEYFCDLPVLYGATIRNYPSNFDNYGWVSDRPTVTRSQLEDVRRVYSLINDHKEQAVALAVKRLNSCLIREDAADALLDATIGLELLLGDDENQALSYKLRMRAGALANLVDDPKRSAVDVAALVKKVYAARSAVVHGRRRKNTKDIQAQDTRFESDRADASDLLRFVLDAFLSHPDYAAPEKIDSELLLNRVVRPNVSKGVRQRRRPRKEREKKV